jgi:hypothetical protein
MSLEEAGKLQRKAKFIAASNIPGEQTWTLVSFNDGIMRYLDVLCNPALFCAYNLWVFSCLYWFHLNAASL